MKNKYERTRDYYADLGLQPSATTREISQSYRKLLLIWAPDKWERREAEIQERTSRSASTPESLSQPSLSSESDISLATAPASPAETQAEAKEESPASPSSASAPLFDTKSSEPGRSSTSSVYEGPRSKSEAEAMTQLLNEAYEVLSDKETRSAYDRDRVPPSMPVDNYDRRKNNLKTHPLPTTEEEFLRCIKEDAKRHPRGNCFDTLIEQSAVVQNSLWRLIESGWLFYEDLESAALDQLYTDSTGQQAKRFSYVCDTVLSRPAVVDHLINELSNEKEVLAGFSPGKISPLIENCTLFESGLIKPGDLRALAWLSSRPLEIEGFDQPLTDSEAFLCYILQANNDEHRKVDHWSPGDWTHGIEGRDSPVIGRHGLHILEFLRLYMGNNPPEIPLQELISRFSSISNIIFQDGTEGLHGLTAVQDRFYQPLVDRLNRLKQKEDASSLEKAQRIETLLKTIEEIMLRASNEWVRLSVEEPELFKQTKTIVNREYFSDSPNLELPELSFLKEISELYNTYQQEAGPGEPEPVVALEAKRDSTPEVKNLPPALQKPESQPGCFGRFFRSHPVITSMASTSLLAVLGIGGMALHQYLNHLDPFNWLQDSIGMGTPADMAVLLAALVVVLLIATGVLAQRAANHLNKEEPAQLNHYAQAPV